MSLYYFDLHVVVCYAAVYAETPLLLVNIFTVVIATAAAADNDNDDDVDDCGHHGNASRLRVQLWRVPLPSPRFSVLPIAPGYSRRSVIAKPAIDCRRHAHPCSSFASLTHSLAWRRQDPAGSGSVRRSHVSAAAVADADAECRDIRCWMNALETKRAREKCARRACQPGGRTTTETITNIPAPVAER